MSGFVNEVYSPVRGDEGRGDAKSVNSPRTSEAGRRRELLNEAPIEDLSEVIRPLPLDKTNECSSDEGLENTGISLVN